MPQAGVRLNKFRNSGKLCRWSPRRKRQIINEAKVPTRKFSLRYLGNSPSSLIFAMHFISFQLNYKNFCFSVFAKSFHLLWFSLMTNDVDNRGTHEIRGI